MDGLTSCTSPSPLPHRISETLTGPQATMRTAYTIDIIALYTQLEVIVLIQ